MWVLKLDNSGQKVWQATLGGTDEDEATSIVELADGGYMVAGYATSTDGDVVGNHGGKDIWAVKLGSNGKKLWQRPFGSPGDDWGEYITTTADGALIMGGFAAGGGDVTGNHGDVDAWIVKFK
jgi:hypothetical protein